MNRHKYLWKPAYPFRYTKMDESEMAKSLAEVMEVAALYESRFKPEKHQYLEEMKSKEEKEHKEDEDNCDIDKENEEKQKKEEEDNEQNEDEEKGKKEGEEKEEEKKEEEEKEKEKKGEEKEKEKKGEEKETNSKALVLYKEKKTSRKAHVLYKYDPLTKSVYKSDFEWDHTSNRRIHINDVEEMQQQLRDDVKRIRLHIDCLNVKLQCVNRVIDYTWPRQSYRDHVRLGTKPCQLCYDKSRDVALYGKALQYK